MVSEWWGMDSGGGEFPGIGSEWFGMVSRGKAWQGEAGHGMIWYGTGGCKTAMARQGGVWNG